MEYWLRTQTPEKQQFDALALVAAAPAAALAGAVVARMTATDAGAVAEHLHYLAALIYAQGGAEP